MGLKEALMYIEREEGREEGLEQGIEQGELRKTEKFIINLIQQMGLSDEQIVKIADTNIGFVQEIRNRMEK